MSNLGHFIFAHTCTGTFISKNSEFHYLRFFLLANLEENT